MNIYQYLTKYKITKRAFAEKVGIAETTLYKYTDFEREPTLANAVKIHKASKGEIKYTDMLKINSDLFSEPEDEDVL